MKDLFDLTVTRRTYSADLFSYPCVDPGSNFFKNNHVSIVNNKPTMLGKYVAEKCKEREAQITDSPDEHTDILIVNTPFIIGDNIPQTEEIYFDILFHYIKPTQKAIPDMLKKNRGQVVFVLPPHALIPSVEYAQMAAFAMAGSVKGLAQMFAPKGVVVNGIVLGEQEDYETIADWIVFLAGNNARNIIGELILCN
jgi:hypothetical protein